MSLSVSAVSVGWEKDGGKGEAVEDRGNKGGTKQRRKEGRGKE